MGTAERCHVIMTTHTEGVWQQEVHSIHVVLIGLGVREESGADCWNVLIWASAKGRGKKYI